MEDPKIKTKVVHSLSKNAWNVVGCTLGYKYKIARVPYSVTGVETLDEIQVDQALNHANFISACFNKSNLIIKLLELEYNKSTQCLKPN